MCVRLHTNKYRVGVQIKCKYDKIEIHWMDSFYLTWMASGWMRRCVVGSDGTGSRVLFYYFCMFGNMLGVGGRHLCSIDFFPSECNQAKIVMDKSWRATACMRGKKRHFWLYFKCDVAHMVWDCIVHNPIIIIIAVIVIINAIPFPGFWIKLIAFFGLFE